MKINIWEILFWILIFILIALGIYALFRPL